MAAGTSDEQAEEALLVTSRSSVSPRTLGWRTPDGSEGDLDAGRVGTGAGEVLSQVGLRLFSADFELDPASTLRLTGIEIGKALPRAKPGGPRWVIFEKAVVDGATVERVNELATRIARRTHGRVEPDADIFIAVFTGYAQLDG